MMLSISAPSMAQDVKSQVTAITKVVVDAKGDVNATKAQVKDFMKANKKNAEALAGLGRAFLTAKNYEQTSPQQRTTVVKQHLTMRWPHSRLRRNPLHT